MEAHMRISNNTVLPIRSLVLITIACLLLPITAAGENQSTAASKTPAAKQTVPQSKAKAAATAKDQEPIEEVTVIGQKQIFSLRMQVIHAEDHAYKIFDALNDDDDYDVHCKMVANTGTHIQRRTCLPNFFYKAQTAEAQQFLGFIGVSEFTAVGPSAMNVWAEKFPIFKAKVKKLVRENPEMRDAMVKLFNLQQELEKSRNIYFGNSGK